MWKKKCIPKQTKTNEFAKRRHPDHMPTPSIFMITSPDHVLEVRLMHSQMNPSNRKDLVRRKLSFLNGREVSEMKSRGFVLSKTNPTLVEAANASLLNMVARSYQVVIHSDGTDIYNEINVDSKPELPINDQLSRALGAIFEHGVRGGIVVEVLPSSTDCPFSVPSVDIRTIEHLIRVPPQEPMRVHGVVGRALAMWTHSRRISLRNGVQEPKAVTRHSLPTQEGGAVRRVKRISSCRFDHDSSAFIKD